MSGPANAGAGFSSALRQRLRGRTVDQAVADEGQARKFQAGLARQREINERTFPVKPQYSRMGTMGPSRLASRESQAATGKPMGTMTMTMKPRSAGASSMAMNGLAAGGFPVKPKRYGADFVGPVPPGGVREAGLLSAPVLDEQTGGAFPVKPQRPGRGFSAFTDERMGAIGWKTDTRDGKAGAVAQDGVYQGQTRGQIGATVKKDWLAMSPEERAKYDEQAEVIGGTAGRPEAPAQSMAGSVAADTLSMHQGKTGLRKGLLEEEMLDDGDEWED